MQPGVTKHHKGSIFSPFLQIPDELEKKGEKKALLVKHSQKITTFAVSLFINGINC